MQLPDFITKALSFFTSAEAKLDKLTAAEQSLTEAKVTVTRLTAELATASTALAAEQTGHTATKAALVAEQAELATTKTALTAAQATIADPKGEIQKQSAMKANEIAARMGCPPIKGEDQTAAANGGKTLLDQYLELNLTNPRAAAEFAAKHGGANGLLSSK